MVDINLSALPNALAVTGGDFLHISQSGGDYRITIDDLSDNFGEADIFGLNTLSSPLGTHYLPISTTASIADNKKTTLNDVSDLLQTDAYYANTSYWNEGDSFVTYRAGNNPSGLSQISLATFKAETLRFNTLTSLPLASINDADVMAIDDLSAGQTKRVTFSDIRQRALNPTSLAQMSAGEIANNDLFQVWDVSAFQPKKMTYANLFAAIDGDLDTSDYMFKSVVQTVTGQKVFSPPSSSTAGIKVDRVNSVNGAGITFVDGLVVQGNVKANGFDANNNSITNVNSLTATGNLSANTASLSSEVSVDDSALSSETLILNNNGANGAGLRLTATDAGRPYIVPRKGDNTSWEWNREITYGATDNDRVWKIEGGLQIGNGGNATNSDGSTVAGTGNLDVAGDAIITGDTTSPNFLGNHKGKFFPSASYGHYLGSNYSLKSFYDSAQDAYNNNFSTETVFTSGINLVGESSSSTKFASGIYPSANSKYSLGESSRRWEAIYADNGFFNTGLSVRNSAYLPALTYIDGTRLITSNGKLNTTYMRYASGTSVRTGTATTEAVTPKALSDATLSASGSITVTNISNTIKTFNWTSSRMKFGVNAISTFTFRTSDGGQFDGWSVNIQVAASNANYAVVATPVVISSLDGRQAPNPSLVIKNKTSSSFDIQCVNDSLGIMGFDVMVTFLNGAT